MGPEAARSRLRVAMHEARHEAPVLPHVAEADQRRAAARYGQAIALREQVCDEVLRLVKNNSHGTGMSEDWQTMSSYALPHSLGDVGSDGRRHHPIYVVASVTRAKVTNATLAYFVRPSAGDDIRQESLVTITLRDGQQLEALQIGQECTPPELDSTPPQDLTMEQVEHRLYGVDGYAVPLFLMDQGLATVNAQLRVEAAAAAVEATAVWADPFLSPV